MRAVFSINVPMASHGGYPTDRELADLLRELPWEPTEVKNAVPPEASGDPESSHAAKLAKGKTLAAPLFDQMPEVAAAEKEDVIFYGYVADDQTRFVVTRPVDGQVTFRLLHPVLPRLQASARKMVKRIGALSLAGTPLCVADNRIVVYERGYDHIIITGRVITRPARETARTNLKDVLLTVVPALLLIPVSVFLFASAHTAAPSTGQSAPNGTVAFLIAQMERLSTALVTTALVSLLGLFTTYFNIKRYRVVAWDVSRDSATDPAS